MTGRIRLLFVLDLGLIGLAAFRGVRVHRVWGEWPPDPGIAPLVASHAPQPMRRSMLTSLMPSGRAMPPAPPESSVAPGFDVVAEQNLFGPTRRETEPGRPGPPVATRLGRAHTPRSLPRRPFLYGVVLGAPGGAHAYLKVSAGDKLLGYVIGDMVGGRVLEEIGAGRVVLREADGESVQVLLRDPPSRDPRFTRPPVRPSRPMRPARR